MLRREFLALVAKAAALATTAAVLRPSSDYGPVQQPNELGLMLPAQFSARHIATSGQPVGNTGFVWHLAPDGGACVPTPGGGWVYVSNCELPSGAGGVNAIKFSPAGEILSVYPILTGTNRSCSGGVTPWGTYLSGEEDGPVGRTFECDPLNPSQGIHRPALGNLPHEMMAVDATTGEVYMVEDAPDGRLYKFSPSNPGSVASGSLFAAVVTAGAVTWVRTSETVPDRSPVTTAFAAGEGMWLQDRTLFFSTKGDVKVWKLDLARFSFSSFAT